MAIEVSTPVYEGPFDLLLQLILREQVDLYQVSLVSIVDAYLAELRSLSALDLEVATEFLLIAATLVELKARRLLPGREDVDLDEELGLWEERDLLLARLLECKTFKDVGAVFSRLADDAGRSFPRFVGPEEPFASLQPDLLDGVSADRLRRTLERLLTPKPVPHVDLWHVAAIRITVADVVAVLADELPGLGPVTFRRLTEGLADRIEVIVHFLAVLELFKQGLVDVDQTEHFGDIVVVWTGGDDPLTPVSVGAVDDYEG